MMKSSKEMIIQSRYINLPVKNGAPVRRMRFCVDDRQVREFSIELAEGEPDFWVVSDVSQFQGQQVDIEVDDSDLDSTALDAITQGDTILGAEDLYHEKYRPQFHFSSRRGWTNDPNGLVYYKGEYHLFYQHNPYGWGPANIHWGHAISDDLFHWREFPDALYPDAMGTMYSGSAVVDWENTSGLKVGEEDTLICFYTAAGSHVEPRVPFSQCLAFSNDRGRTWHKYSGNPVVPHIVRANRDPKVIWHQSSRQWVMALCLDKTGERRFRYALYTSPDLITWRHLQDVFLPHPSCPDFFSLPVDGDPTKTKWVFWGADGHYVFGSFDGNEFTPETSPLRAYCGGHYAESGSVEYDPDGAYAAQTWSDLPAEDGRRIQIAWLRRDMPGMPFNQQMTLPVELRLGTTEEGIRLLFSPVEEIDKLHKDKQTLRDTVFSADPIQLPTGGRDLLDIRADIDVGQAAEIVLTIRGIPVVYDVEAQELSCRNRTGRLRAPGGRLQLRILLDRASIEIFAARGQVYLALGTIPKDDDRSCFLSARGGKGKAIAVDVFQLQSIWD